MGAVTGAKRTDHGRVLQADQLVQAQTLCALGTFGLAVPEIHKDEAVFIWGNATFCIWTRSRLLAHGRTPILSMGLGQRRARFGRRMRLSEPPAGRSRWTMRLLAGRMVELAYADGLSHETVRETLKKTCSSRT